MTKIHPASGLLSMARAICSAKSFSVVTASRVRSSYALRFDVSEPALTSTRHSAKLATGIAMATQKARLEAGSRAIAPAHAYKRHRGNAPRVESAANRRPLMELNPARQLTTSVTMGTARLSRMVQVP
jgi:hypothetical protein